MGKSTPPSIEKWIDNLDKEEISEFQKKFEIENPEGFIPYDVKIKLTFRCNAKCYYCLHGIRTLTEPETYSKDDLSTFELKHIIKELATIGTKVITFSGGEPTLRKDLPDLVELSSSLGLRVKMTTNGSLISPELADRLGKAGMKSVNISLDGINEDHDNVRGKNMFERTWNGIKYLDAAFKKYGNPKLRINHVLTANNYNKLRDFLQFIDSTPVNIEAVNLLFIETGHNSEKLSLDHPKIIEILDQFQHLRQKINIDIRESNMLLNLDMVTSNIATGNYTPEMLELPCYFPFLHMFVLPNADVIVCCGAERDEEHIIGNLREQSVEELWNSKEYRELREYLKYNKFKYCLSCDHGVKINQEMHQVLTKLDVIQ